MGPFSKIEFVHLGKCFQTRLDCAFRALLGHWDFSVFSCVLVLHDIFDAFLLIAG